MIMGYLALFRLQELGTKQFEAFVTTQDPTVLHVFLSYVFNPEKLRGRVWAEWIRVLDSDFLEVRCCCFGLRPGPGPGSVDLTP